MIQVTCDRCGKAYKMYVSKRGNNGMQFMKRTLHPRKVKTDMHNGYSKMEYERPFSYQLKSDLCPECMKELEDWYFEEKDDEEEGVETVFGEKYRLKGTGPKIEKEEVEFIDAVDL